MFIKDETKEFGEPRAEVCNAQSRVTTNGTLNSPFLKKKSKLGYFKFYFYL